jgi:hypothetical protein
MDLYLIANELVIIKTKKVGIGGNKYIYRMTKSLLGRICMIVACCKTDLGV